jgi:hypothetical protein
MAEIYCIDGSLAGTTKALVAVSWNWLLQGERQNPRDASLSWRDEHPEGFHTAATSSS